MIRPGGDFEVDAEGGRRVPRRMERHMWRSMH